MDSTEREAAETSAVAHAPGPGRRGWAAHAAAAWALIYGALGLYWTLGGAGYPFGENDPLYALSVLGGVRAGAGAPVIAGLSLAGTVVALAMARSCGRGIPRASLLAFAWIAAAGSALVIPDYRRARRGGLRAHRPPRRPFGWPPGDFSDAIPWPVLNQFVCIVGGLLWAATAMAYARRSRGACAQCGRTGSADTWTTPESAARWGMGRVGRGGRALALRRDALGVGTGHPSRRKRRVPARGAGEQAVVGRGGAGDDRGGRRDPHARARTEVGEMLPCWLPFLSGKRVPVWLAVVPASLAAVLVRQAGLMYVRLTLDGTLVEEFGEGGRALTAENWAALGPELLWPLWGVALSAATLAYYYRRRGTCRRCGRG